MADFTDEEGFLSSSEAPSESSFEASPAKKKKAPAKKKKAAKATPKKTKTTPRGKNAKSQSPKSRSPPGSAAKSKSRSKKSPAKSAANADTEEVPPPENDGASAVDVEMDGAGAGAGGGANSQSAAADAALAAELAGSMLGRRRRRTPVNYAADAAYDSEGMSMSRSEASAPVVDSGSDFEAGQSDDEDDFGDEDDDEFEASPVPAKRSRTAASSKSAGKKTPTAKRTTAAPKRKTPASSKKSKAGAGAAAAADSDGDFADSKPSKTKKSAPRKKATAKKSPAPKSLSEKAGAPVVFDYVQKQNRPYNAVQIFENLHKTIKLPFVKRILASLAKEGRIKLKENGKQLYYFPDQSQYTDCSPEAIAEARAEAKAAEDEFTKWNTKANELSRRADAMGHQLTDSDLTVRLQELEEQNKALEERIAQLEDLGTSTDPKMKDELVAQIKKWKKIWRERRLSVMDIVENASEGMEPRKSVEQLMEEWGLESDASVGVRLRDYGPP